MTASRYLPSLLAIPAACLALAACGGTTTVAAKRDEDPALASALAGPVMTDPELSHLDAATAAIAGGGPVVIELPPVEVSSEAIAAIGAEATKAAGRPIEQAPQSTGEMSTEVAGAITPAQLVDALDRGKSGCGAKLQYGFGWTLRLIEPFGIYPRGHAILAAGSDEKGCAWRVATFLTPIKPGDVLNYYYTRAKAANYAANRSGEGEVQLLSGGKQGARFAIRVRQQDNELTRIDLLTSS